MQNKKTSVSLVLGSGGARGLAHIGVIHWLEQNNFDVKSISGCSMGALIGGVYAAGKLDSYEQWIRAITKVDIVTLLDLSWQKSGLVKGDKIINTLIELVGNRLIDDLPIKFTAVASDIKAGKEVWINTGRLFDAIRASISLPLFFTPFEYNGVPLIDGGVLNPVPIAPTFGDDTDITIAVNLAGEIDMSYKQVVPQSKNEADDSPIRNGINQFINKLKSSVVNSSGLEYGIYDVASQAFEAMQTTIARQKLAAYPPDLTIEISRNACKTLEFDRAVEMIKLGYRKTSECMSNKV